MGKCCCKNIMRCTELQNKIILKKKELLYGCFDIRASKSNKQEEFRKKCAYYLGIGVGNQHHLRIRKLHFHPDVLRYINKSKKYVTTPISREQAITEGLLDHTTPYQRKTYFLSRIFLIMKPTYLWMEFVNATRGIIKTKWRRISRNKWQLRTKWKKYR